MKAVHAFVAAVLLFYSVPAEEAGAPGLSIANASFSEPVLEDGAISFDVPGWLESTISNGNYNEYVYRNISHFTNDGNLGSIATRAGFLYQNIGSVPENAETLTLQMDLFQRSIRKWGGLRVMLFAGDPSTAEEGADILGDSGLHIVGEHTFASTGLGFREEGADEIRDARTSSFSFESIVPGTSLWIRLDAPQAGSGLATYFDNLQLILNAGNDPELIEFSLADGPIVSPGTRVELSWVTSGAAEIRILANGERIHATEQASGAINVEVWETTRFDLIVEGNGIVLTDRKWIVAREGPPPNILLFVIDDFGWSDWEQNGEASGSDLHETPSMDKLAQDGIWFTEGYAAAPVCSPSRGVLLTGQSSARTRLTDWIPGSGDNGRPIQEAPWLPRLELSRTTIAERLSEIGYRTIHIGKWHLGEWDNAETDPTRQGFDINIGGNNKGNPPSGYFPDSEGSFQIPGLESGFSSDDYLTDVLTDRAIDAIRNATTDETPFFLHLSHYAVHSPIQAPPESVGIFEEKLAGMEGPVIHDNATYAAMVYHVDQSLEMIREEMESLGIAENTMILLVSDNGGLLPVTSSEPLRGGKGLNHEGGRRVPYIISWPGVLPPNLRSGLPVGGRDITPTILDAIDPGYYRLQEVEFDGESLWPELLKPGSYKRDRPIVLHYPHFSPQGGNPHSMIRLKNWKLIYNYTDKSVELYDLSSDIGEEFNVVSENPIQREALFESMIQVLRLEEAAFPMAWDGASLDPAQVIPLSGLFAEGHSHRLLGKMMESNEQSHPSYWKDPYLYKHDSQSWYFVAPASTLDSTFVFEYSIQRWLWTQMDILPWVYDYSSGEWNKSNLQASHSREHARCTPGV